MKAKKVLAMLMASAMIMGTTVTAFAADVNITTDHSSDKFQYLQLIKADTQKASGWTFVNDDIAKDYSDAWDLTSSEDPNDKPTVDEQQSIIWQLIKKENPNATIPGMPSSTTPAADANIAEALKNVEGGTGESYTLSSEQSSSFDVPEAGVYYIKGLDKDSTDGTDMYSPMAAYVGLSYNSERSVNTDAKVGDTLTAKKAPGKPDKESTDDNKVVEVSSVTTYEIKTKVPYISYDKTQDRFYRMKDTLTNGDYVLEPANLEDGTSNPNANKLKVTVKVDGMLDPITKYVDVTENPDGTDTFTLILDELVNDSNDLNLYAQHDITISYDVRVTGVEVTNDVDFDDGDNFSDPTYGGDTEKVYTAEIELIKYAADETPNTLEDNDELQGAEFKIYKIIKDAENKDKNVYLKQTVTNGKMTIEWVDKIEDATPFITGADGHVKVTGLDVGTYYFQETKAPDGYTLNKEPVPVIVTQETEATGIVKTTPVTMIDTTLSSLPSTGGIGTTIFTIGGCAIMVTAAGLYFATRKKEQN